MVFQPNMYNIYVFKSQEPTEIGKVYNKLYIL